MRSVQMTYWTYSPALLPARYRDIQGMRFTVAFENGKVSAIETGSQFVKQYFSCLRTNAIGRGDDAMKVQTACGIPDNASTEDVTKPVTTTRVVWIYQQAKFLPAIIMQFSQGFLARIQSNYILGAS